MKKIAITERAPDAISREDTTGVAFTGDIASRKIVDKDDFRLSLWRHELAPGAAIHLDRPAEDHIFYVVDGELLVGGTPVPPRGAASIGAGAISEVSGGAQGATVLEYVGDAETRPDKPGGCVHILSQPWMEHTTVSSHALYFDSSCPNCSVWLHMTRVDKGGATPPHYHTEDEIICVVQGDMNLGTRSIATGGAVGVAKQVVYSFEAGDEGLGFVNFRQADPFFLLKGKKLEEAKSERELVRALLGRLSRERMAGAVSLPRPIGTG